MKKLTVDVKRSNLLERRHQEERSIPRTILTVGLQIALKPHHACPGKKRGALRSREG
jgi:hypothetical protein